jgi:hypothetical protein
MTSLFLAKLPREIRDQIYIYVLAPTGSVVLPDATNIEERGWRSTGARLEILPFVMERSGDLRESVIKLSLLRVCKQIHGESKDLLWRHNALYLQRPSDLTIFIFWDRLAYQLSHFLCTIDMDFVMFDQRHIRSTKKALETFVAWSRTGSLRKINLIFVKRIRIRHGYDTNFEELLAIRTKAHIGSRLPMTWPTAEDCMKYWDLLWEVGSVKDGFAPHVQKRMIINSGLRNRNAHEKQQWLNRMLHSDPSGFATKLHEAFDGELWIDGVLCYKDGLQLYETFWMSDDDEVALVAERDMIDQVPYVGL